ncbi:MAG: hypothetical protein C4521_01535 [Actinobacteria bacterium]|nr:MAG: hypothetical protein C4521_01535 [Actinomycetota bacterium]
MSRPIAWCANLQGTAVRATASLALLAFVFYKIDLGQVFSAFARMDARYLPAIFALIYIAVAVGVLKWDLILKARQVRVRSATLFDFYMIGLFFNNFLPSSIGGAVVQAYETARRTGNTSDTTASIVADRLIASSSLGLLALIGLFAVDRTPKLVALVLLFAAGSIAVLAAFAHPRLLHGLIERTIRGHRGRLGDWTAETAGALGQILTDWPLVIRSAALSLVFQLVLALLAVVTFWAIGERVDVGHAFVFVPIISALTVLPVSLSGLGVREAAYVYFFGTLGVAASQAVAASLLFFATVAIASLPGAVLFIAGRRARASSSGANDSVAGRAEARGVPGPRENELLPELAAERAALHYRRGSNCAEAVIQSLDEVLGRGDVPVAAGSAWQGGISRTGCLCGALAGATIMAGVLSDGDGASARSRRRTAAAAAVRIKEAFEEEYGSSCCRTIRRRLSPDSPESTRRCGEITAETARIAACVLAPIAGPVTALKAGSQPPSQRTSLSVQPAAQPKRAGEQ